MPLQLTIQIVGWNSAATLGATARKLQEIPVGLCVIRYIDNASTDDSVAIIKQILPHADIVRLTRNEGFAAAHNRGLSLCTTPFVLTHDPDVEIVYDGLMKLLEVFADKRVGAVQGKVLRAKRSTAGESRIDSAGIVLTRALNGRERGSYEIDTDQYNTRSRLLAVTGACGLYRLEALHAVAEAGQCFDEDFFAYKEDVDLGWRLNRAGWLVIYVPTLVAYHHRTLGRRGVFNWGLSWTNIYQRLRSPRTRYSLRNWIWMIVKNAHGRQVWASGIFVLLRALTWFIASMAYPPLLKTWVEIVYGLARAWRKRNLPMATLTGVGLTQDTHTNL